jgi:hypothetical protein
LFWEIEPAVRFPAVDDHDMTYRITFKLEGVFGYNDTADINQGFIPTSTLRRRPAKPQIAASANGAHRFTHIRQL